MNVSREQEINIMSQTDKQVIQSIKNSIPGHIIEHLKELIISGRRGILENQETAKWHGVSTFCISISLKVSTKKARQELEKLHRKGLVIKCSQGRGISTLWWPVGYIDEIFRSI